MSEQSIQQTQPKQIELADAYRETCAALGEAITMQRLLSQELMQTQMKVSELEAQLADPHLNRVED